MGYQDVLDEAGNVVRAGSRECASRWDAIHSDMQGAFDAEDVFRVLDLGAYEGYFTRRLLDAYPNAEVVAVDDWRGLPLALAGSPARVINERLSSSDVGELGSFEVTLCLSVLHHVPEWREMFSVIHDQSDQLYLEVPDASEVLPKAVAHSAELSEYVQGLGSRFGERLTVAPGHRSDIPRTLWVFR